VSFVRISIAGAPARDRRRYTPRVPTKHQLATAARDPFWAHEALDRTHLISTTFFDFIQEHRFILAHPHLARRAEKIGDDFGRLYQEIGQLSTDLPENNKPKHRPPRRRPDAPKA
jgi:hypothetical protein